MSRPASAFWSGRRVLVTGNTGFKGAWLCAYLETLGSTIGGIALAPDSEPNLFTLMGLDARMESRFVDIRDPNATATAIRAFRPSTIVHLAAQPLVRRGYAEPLATYATNVMGTAHILDAARGLDTVGEIIVVTSDKVYADDPVRGGYTELARLGGADPYAGSKAAAELVVETFRSAFFTGGRGPRVATARAGNVIGGGDYAADRLLPDFVRAIEAKRPLLLRQPNAIRPWQHVLDPLCGYLLLAERLATGESAARSWNFGPDGPGTTVRRVVELFADAWGNAEECTYRFEPGGKLETHCLEIDATAARRHLRWVSRWSTQEAVERTAHWYRENLSGVEASRLIAEDLSAYTEIAQVCTA